jgi:hypothetical protein
VARARVVAARPVAARAVRARARSVAVPLRLAGEEHEAAAALQHWQPDHFDKGDGGGVSGVRRWRLAGSKLG